MRHLTTADYQRMRWKNGGGMTTEIALQPRPDGAEGFIWRVSIADVESDGPFSTFPGCDRIIMLIEGKGMSIDAGARGFIALSQPDEPRRFSGDWPVSGRLIDGPVKDFNLIFSRDLVDASLEVVSIEMSVARTERQRNAGASNPACAPLHPGNHAMLIYVLSGTARAGEIAASAGETIVAGPDDGGVVILGDGRLAVARFIRRTAPA